MYLSHLHLFVY